jgi:hypothetical protein
MVSFFLKGKNLLSLKNTKNKPDEVWDSNLRLSDVGSITFDCILIKRVFQKNYSPGIEHVGIKFPVVEGF